MTATTSIQPVTSASFAIAGVPQAAPTGGALLPAPAASAMDVGDAMTVLLQMSSSAAEGQARLGEARARSADNQRRESAARRKEALDRAVEATKRAQEESSGGFFSFITDNIGAVGLIGLVTFRWDLVATDILSHQAGLSDGTTGVVDLGAVLAGGPLGFVAAQALDKLAPEGLRSQDVAAFMLAGPLGSAIQRGAEKLVPDDLLKDLAEIATIADDDVRVANKYALMAAMTAIAATSAVLSGGTSAPAIIALIGIGISTTTQIAAETGALKKVFGEKAAMYIALGGAAAGAVLSLGGSAASLSNAAASAATVATKATKVANAASAAASVAQGVLDVKAGVSELRRADAQREADLADIDAQQEKHVMKRVEKLIDDIIGDLRDAKQSSERAAEILQGTLQTNSQTLLLAGSLKV